MLADIKSILGIVFLLIGFFWTPALAQEGAAFEEEELVRLPGQGELRQGAVRKGQLERLVPGGGLLLSFDADANGWITPAEIDQGITLAFGKADTNGNGRITPLEQIKWTETLPTRDVSLANPARFDPNLDRSVRIDEFTEVIVDFAAIYADKVTGEISVMALKSTKDDSKTTEIEATQSEQDEKVRPRSRGRSSR